MKRTLAVLLAVLMIFGCAALTACNKTGLVNDRDDAQIISADEIADTMDLERRKIRDSDGHKCRQAQG